jgi:deazaflavin-dependent oxidoreductase (nitroreductase family)
MDMKAINPGVIEEYRRTGGRLSGELGAMPVLLLTTTGRRSGTAHTTPLGYVEDGARFVVAASAAGSAVDPDWYRNLVASPSVTVEVGADSRTVRATVARGAERDRLFERLTATLPGMAQYAAASGREVPVVVLNPEQTNG